MLLLHLKPRFTYKNVIVIPASLKYRFTHLPCDWLPLDILTWPVLCIWSCCCHWHRWHRLSARRICAWLIESDKGSQRVPTQCQRKAGLGSLLSRGSHPSGPLPAHASTLTSAKLHVHLIMHWLYTFTIYTGWHCELHNVFFSQLRQAVNSLRTWCFKQRSVLTI